ncbi:MAG: oligosaccharide flippase family protein [Planctomycetia bacterium]|nr:oligosaccharide flippase family protein [Planctomycetia bacterium]
MTQGQNSATDALSVRTARGLAWMIAQTLGSKLAGMIGQIFLARLLLPKDYGLIAIAYIAASLPTVLRQTGILQILIQKGHRFSRWANAAFWMELAMGVVAMLLMLMAAPIAAMFYHASALWGLMALISTGSILNALMSVPAAKLTMDLRFKELAAIGLGYNVLSMAISVGCAFLGLGAYSFVIPLPICLFLRALVLWRLAPVKVRWNPQFHRWRAMAADSGRLMVGGLAYLVQVQADNFALSIWHGKATVGNYFFANNLSGQVLQLLAVNFAGVLFPALSQLKNEPGRQVSAFLRAARALALIGIPICVAEAVLAKPAILVIFGAKWMPAVTILQVAALAAAINLAGAPSANLLQAQGRFHLNMIWSLISAVLFTLLVFTGAFFGGPVLVATGGLLCAAFVAPARTFSVVRYGGGRVADIARVFVPPLLFAGLALAPVGFLELLVPWFDSHYVATLAVGAVTAPLIYLPLVWHFCPGDVDELLIHSGPLGQRLRQFVNHKG